MSQQRILRRQGSIRKLCEVCGAEFRTTPKVHHSGQGRFCSRACCTVARHEGLVRPKGKKAGRGDAFTAEEEAFIREHYLKKSAAWIGQQIGRSRHGVKNKAARMGLARAQFKVKAWTPEDEEWLRDHYSQKSIADIAKHLGRTETAVKLRAKLLEVRRTDFDEMSASDVAAIFGVDRKTPLTWIGRGWLKGKKVEHLGAKGTWQISGRMLRQFVLEHPFAFDLHKVDRLSFFDILSGRGV